MENTIGKRIAALRREKGLKQEDVAQQLEVSSQAVSKWENDQSCPDISLLPKLAKLLGVTVDTLLTGEEKPAAVLKPAAERKDDAADRCGFGRRRKGAREYSYDAGTGGY